MIDTAICEKCLASVHLKDYKDLKGETEGSLEACWFQGQKVCGRP